VAAGDEETRKGQFDDVARLSVEETLSGLLDAEVGAICRAQHYGRSPERTDCERQVWTR